jgi:hypothetical protein
LVNIGQNAVPSHIFLKKYHIPLVYIGQNANISPETALLTAMRILSLGASVEIFKQQLALGSKFKELCFQKMKI